MGSIIDYLRAHGPSPKDELPVSEITVQHRQQGVTRFKLQNSTGRGGDSTAWGGRTLSVYYLLDEHSKREVIEAWLDVNAQAAKSKRTAALTELFGDQGPSWRDAARDVLHGT